MTPSPPFTLLARVYDAIMADIDYEEWADFILAAARERGFAGGLVLDLGCGTGNSSFPMFARGLAVTGLDASPEMLGVARAKLPPARFVQGDFATFALPERFALAYAMFDALNNLLTPEAFLAAARNIRAHLEPGGLLIFDANTTVGLRELWESGRAEGWSGDVYYRWEHTFDEATGLARVDAYCEDKRAAFTEVHYERPYDPPELEHLLTAAGFGTVEVLSFPGGEPATPEDARVWAVAKKQGRCGAGGEGEQVEKAREACQASGVGYRQTLKPDNRYPFQLLASDT